MSSGDSECAVALSLASSLQPPDWGMSVLSKSVCSVRQPRLAETQRSFCHSWEPAQPFVMRGLQASCALSLEPFETEHEGRDLR